MGGGLRVGGVVGGWWFEGGGLVVATKLHFPLLPSYTYFSFFRPHSSLFPPFLNQFTIFLLFLFHLF